VLDDAPITVEAPAFTTSGAATAVLEAPAAVAAPVVAPVWAPDGEKELGKIPFFVRGKARRNTEAYAKAQGISVITVDTLYEAKAHYAR
jgi:light-independent protochlorophyllide reductase subunit B